MPEMRGAAVASAIRRNPIRDVKRPAPGRESRSTERRAGFAIALIVIRES